MRCDDEINDTLFGDLLSLISLEKQQRINEYRLRKVAQNSLLGEAILLYGLNKFFMRGESLKFRVNEYGKPFLISNSNIQYNISHTDNHIACVMAVGVLAGIDVETIKPIDISLAKRFFEKDEVDYIFGQPVEQQIRCFYRIWTRKESYVKMVGEGLNIPLDSFSVLANNNFHFYEFLTTDEVIGTVCTREKEVVSCEEVCLGQLLGWLEDRKCFNK